MPQTDIGNATVTSNTQTDYSVDAKQTDGTYDQKETIWTNENWSQYFGYYKTIPEFAAVTDAKATWTVGKGFMADKVTTFNLSFIRGWGKDTFNTIIENMIRTYHIGGDAFAEIIRNKEGILINLKSLDPGTISIVVDQKGIIKRYEQNSKIRGKLPKRFKPDQIFHLARNRVADEIHGNTMTERLAEIILMRNEAMTDWKRVMHRNVDPVIIIHADTDDPMKIAKIRSDWESVKKNGETWIVPKDVIVPEFVTVGGNASLNPLPWIESLNNYFYQSAGVPQIILGGTGAITEAAVKIAYLAFQQTIEEEQLFIEEQVAAQLGLGIELEFPASLENELISDKKKDRTKGAVQKNDTTAGIGK